MRFLVIADIHANLTALEAVLDDAGRSGGFDEVWSLGDTVGYGPDPGPCVDRLMSLHAFSVTGNHDRAATGQESAERFNPQAQDALKWTTGQLTSLQKSWLDRQRDTETDSDFTLVHGSPRDPIHEYLVQERDALAMFTLFHTPYCLYGHTHVPTVFTLTASDSCKGRQATDGLTLALNAQPLMVNPGSVGQPRDGDARAAYVLLDSIERRLTFHRVRYDVAAVQARMRQAALPWRLIMRLGSGR
jgi:diadenosine tetraphosphatase ApaH/serine/threonine PP2A family protein phosphatase